MNISKKNVENTGFLTAATLLISSGVALINDNLWAGGFIVTCGVVLFLARELRKR